MKFVSINTTECADHMKIDVTMKDAGGECHTFGTDIPLGVTAEAASLCIRVLCNEMLVRDGAQPGQFPEYGV